MYDIVIYIIKVIVMVLNTLLVKQSKLYLKQKTFTAYDCKSLSFNKQTFSGNSKKFNYTEEFVQRL